MKNIQHYYLNPISIVIGIRVLAFAVLLLMAACDDFVEVPLPDSQLTGDAVFEDRSTAHSAMAQVYIKMRNTGLMSGQMGASSHLGLYADELQDYTATSTTAFYNNSLVGENATVLNIWNASYNQIYDANSIIEGVTQSVSLAQADRSQLKGEALFLRALVHFNLTNVFGDVPYVTSTDYNLNSRIRRTPVSTVYQMVAADLEMAVTLLPETYISPERVRANKMAAYALLAKTYLYMGLYAEAANAASAVLNSSLYAWETDLNKEFLKDSGSTIWQFMPSNPGENTLEGAQFIFTMGPPPLLALRQDFIDSFEADDQRKLAWTNAVTDGTTIWYQSFKYKQGSATTVSQEYSVVFRLAEQYLIRAEARARQGELSGAKEDLNKVRNRAGLPNSEALSSEAIVAAVLQERRFELFTEFGHRFFDLKRNNAIDAVLGVKKPGWNPTDKLWPIPSTELSANPALEPQNPSY